MNDSLADAWKHLAASSDESSGLRRIRVEPMHYHVYAGWTVPTAHPAFAAVVDADSVPPNIDLPQSAGFTISINPLPHDPAHSIILLKAESEQYHEVFDRLAEDIRSEIKNSDSTKPLVAIFAARLRQWQLFLSRRHAVRLSRSEQIGLWGELWFLRSHLMHKLGMDSAILAWQGPEGANKDFEYADQAVEVKTSSANPEGKVHISNILQLVDKGLNALYLRHISVSLHHAAGLTLPDLISRIRADLGAYSSARQQFEMKLFAAGYLDSEETYYHRLGCAVLSETTFRVTHGFPRLLPGTLPPGVGDVKYLLSLGACQEFKVEPDPFEKDFSDE